MSRILLFVWQTVKTLIRRRVRRRLIWVYTICKGLSVPILRGITVFIFQTMKSQRMKCILLLMSFGCIRATSAPYYCSYINKDGYFECDYSKMSDVIYRPIDFDQFDPVPQRLKVMVNGYFPYYSRYTFSYLWAVSGENVPSGHMRTAKPRICLRIRCLVRAFVP